MIKKLKHITIQLIAGANIASVVLMLLAGYSDRINPIDHPMLSTIGMTFPVLLLLNLAFLVVNGSAHIAWIKMTKPEDMGWATPIFGKRK